MRAVACDVASVDSSLLTLDQSLTPATPGGNGCPAPIQWIAAKNPQSGDVWWNVSDRDSTHRFFIV